MSVKTFSLKKDGNIFLSKHFQVKEFKCKDGSDKILINTDLIAVLEKLHKYLDCKAINITSGYRTPEHSAKVGGYKTDQHTKGNAADIECKKKDGTYYTSNEVCCALEEIAHMGGVGKINDKSAVHVDVRGKKCWFDETNKEKTCESWYVYFGMIKKGDTNGDGKITPADARLALRASAKLDKLTSEQKKAADVNDDGNVTPADAREILRMASGLK